MTGMASEKQREHIRNYEAQRKAKGWVKATDLVLARKPWKRSSR
jgi:hypothetical protein